ncbi:MAG: AMP-binding protein, partial [Myxococcaceae bacterium]
LPLYHDMGLIGFVLAPLFHQTQITFLPTLSFVKSAAIWMETIHKKRATVTFAPNFAYALITKRAKPEMLARWDLSRMRAWGCGAEPINPDVMRSFLKTFEPCGVKSEQLLPSYGMAEATLAITFPKMDQPLTTDRIDAEAYQADRRAKPASADAKGKKTLELVSCGKAFPHHELAIFDEKDRPLREREIGQVVLRGPSVAAGYFRDPETSAKTLAGGWLHTGDLGYLADGQLYIAGRMKDLIIVNGRNYDPQRIEWIVDEMAGVRKGSAVAFSRPGESSEELIVVAESREEDLEPLKAAIRQRVNEQMQLNAADVVLVAPGALPKTSSGKLQRQKTRQQYLDGTVGTEGVRTLGSGAQRLKLAKHLTLSLMGRGRHMARGILRVTVDGVRAPQNTLVGRTVARLLGATPRPENRN